MNIKPFDRDIRERLTAVSIVNDFRVMGCRTRADFVDTIVEHNSSFDTPEKRALLIRFWNGRDKTLIADLQNVLSEIKKASYE